MAWNVDTNTPGSAAFAAISTDASTCQCITMQARPGNAGNIYIASAVGATDYYTLAATDELTVFADSPSLVFAKSDNGSEVLEFVVNQRTNHIGG